jgi:hypothetical protein
MLTITKRLWEIRGNAGECSIDLAAVSNMSSSPLYGTDGVPSNGCVGRVVKARLMG